jgi:hypothetical protein
MGGEFVCPMCGRVLVMVFVAGEVYEQGMERRLPEEPIAGGRGFFMEGRVVDGARVYCGS